MNSYRAICRAFQKNRPEQAGAVASFAIHLRNSPVKLTTTGLMYYFGMQHALFTISNILIVSLKFMAHQIIYYELCRKI